MDLAELLHASPSAELRGAYSEPVTRVFANPHGSICIGVQHILGISKRAGMGVGGAR